MLEEIPRDARLDQVEGGTEGGGTCGGARGGEEGMGVREMRGRERGRGRGVRRNGGRFVLIRKLCVFHKATHASTRRFERL